MKIGEIIIGQDIVTINENRISKNISIINTGDRPIQIGSHFHIFEANKFLSFDRIETFGFRLDIPSGTAVRFEPNMEKQVSIIPFSGNKRIFGLNNLTDSQINTTTLEKSILTAKNKKFII